MKIWRNKFLKQMIIVITVIFLVMNCVAPNYVYANKARDGINFSWQNIATIVGGVIGGVASVIATGGLSLVAVAVTRSCNICCSRRNRRWLGKCPRKYSFGIFTVCCRSCRCYDVRITKYDV